MNHFRKTQRATLLLALLTPLPALAAAAEAYSPAVRQPVTRLFWGDTHLHTVLSADAYITGTRLTAEDSYRFARGETVASDVGIAARLRQPLDFLAVTDHSDYLGVYAGLVAGDPGLEGWDLGSQWGELLAAGKFTELGIAFANAVQSTDDTLKVPRGFQQNTWSMVAETADRYNEPGSFTAFIGYEWTSMISGDNLHRVVLYRDDAGTATRHLPYSAQESTDPEDLWLALASFEDDTGGQVLAIAHNGNVSNGRMFAPQTLKGKPLDEDYARERMRWEPIYEVTQVKGDGETHPALSPSDEFADFETWDEGNITLTAPKEDWMLKYEYARSGLREGLRHDSELGTNPFQFGMIGSTDSHTGLATAAEDNFFGKFVESEPAATRASAKMAHALQASWQLGASGLAAIWAEENTREALFNAMQRREVYGTTGPRIRLRFFGGWDFQEDLHKDPNYAEQAYRDGVPMGGELIVRRGEEQAPAFLVVAEKDPNGANLDRVQIVKGWLDDEGNTHEQVFDVALSDNRQPDAETGAIPALPSTVDVARASYRNSTGAGSLATVWRDPDFEPSESAFYYVRVIEIEKPRWTAYDAKHFNAEMPAEAPMIVQDRAYSSPIWYKP